LIMRGAESRFDAEAHRECAEATGEAFTN
jgi:hypothetical protein